MTWFAIIGIVVVLFIFISAISGSDQEKKNKEKLKEMGINPEDKINMGKYVAGHPDIDESIEKVVIYSIEKTLQIFFQESDTLISMPEKRGAIEINMIQDITIEDATTIEKNVSIKRMLLVGVFAFAWKKKKKNELAYLVVKWNDGKFEHETIFEYEGKGAMENVNSSRNKLIKIVR